MGFWSTWTTRSTRPWSVAVVAGDTAQLEGVDGPTAGGGIGAGGGRGVEEPARDRLGDPGEARDGPAVEHRASLAPGPRAHVDDPVRASDDAHVVLDDEDRVAARPQLLEHHDERLGVGGVQAGARLVEDVHDAEETRSELGRDAQALHLAG
jgi:hypothetical protein